MHTSLSFSSLPKPLFPFPKCPFLSPSYRRFVSPSSPMATSTMYELLSVPQTAPPHDIRAAYKREARRWHPDMCPGDGEKEYFSKQFIKVRQAYEVLSDPARRQEYDMELGTGARVRYRNSGFADWESQLEGLLRRSDARMASRNNQEGRVR